MNNKWILKTFVCLPLLLSAVLSGDQLTFDPYLSPYSSSNSILYLEEQLLSLQARYKDDKYNSLIATDYKDYFNPEYNYLNGPYYLSNGWPERITRSTLRFLELSCIWYPVNFMTEVVQHEVFGHGYRVRELGRKKAEVSGYNIRFKIDKSGFGLKKAATYYMWDPSEITPSEKIAIAIAGCEGASILAHNVLMSWLEKGKIDGRQVSLWRCAHFELFEYVQTLRKLNGLDLCFVDSGHDIASYLIQLNLIYPSDSSLDQQLDNLRLKTSLSVLLNPFSYLSFYSHISYILFNSSVKIPGFRSEKFYFLPGYKFSLSPFGPEDVIEFFCWSENLAPTYIYIKSGSFSKNDYFGAGGENRSIFQTKFGTLGLKVDLWIQPKLLSRPFSSETKVGVWTNRYSTDAYIESEDHGFSQSDLFSSNFGGSFSVIYRYGVKGSFLNNTWVQLGYKTKGYLPGEPLRQSPIVKLGMKVAY